MKKLMVYYSGYCEIPVNEVKLMDCGTQTVKTAEEWLSERGNIDGLILESLADAINGETDGDRDIDMTVGD